MTLFGINEKLIRNKVSKVGSVCGCTRVTCDITECGQLKLQSLSQTGGWEGLGGWGAGFGGDPAATAGTLAEIKQLKIDRHSETFKDCKV